MRYSPRLQKNLATSLVELLPLLLYGAAEVMADVVTEEKPPEVNFLTVWHFLKGLPNWPMVALPPGPQGCLTQERRLVLY